MKKLFSIVFTAGLLFAGTAFAQGMMGNWQGGTSTIQSSDANISTALQDIYKSQNITSQSQVSCSKVTDDQFEKLGDASMGYGITEQQHTAMENMMGGEGSATVKQAHINMGRAYLGCWSNYNSGPVLMPMMGYSGSLSAPVHNYYYGQQGMMGNLFNSGWGMMGGYNGNFSWLGAITTILVWALLVLGIVALVKWLRRKP